MPSDQALVAQWLHGRPETTRRAYRAAIDRVFLRVELATATLEDLQRVVGALERLAPRSRGLTIAAIKSFYSFHAGTGAIPANPAARLKPPRIPSDLADRILSEEETRRLIAAAPEGAERAMLSVLYAAGLRVSELCGLRWRSLAADKDGGRLNVIGKGGKARTVTLPPGAWTALAALQPDNATPEDPVSARRALLAGRSARGRFCGS